VKFGLIQTEKATYPVRVLCRALQVSASGFYAWCRRGLSSRAREDAVLKVAIRAAHAASHRTYGSPRILADLKANGQRVGRKRVARLMREEGIEGQRKRRFRATTDSRHSLPVAANHLNRDFSASAPNEVWSLTSPTSGPEKAGCSWRRSWTCSPGVSSAGPWTLTSIRLWSSPLWAWP
jgi:putative transposase